MIHWIVRSSMQLRLVIITIAMLLIFFGITQLRKTPVDILPEFSRPYVEIQTEALGLSAAEVEALITTPMEADMLNGVSWVDEIRSESIPGLSSIVLIFEPGTDIMSARQMVQERLVSVYALPGVSKPPAMLNPLSSTSRCLTIGLTSENLSPIEISVLARWTIKPRLMGVPGVANVSIWGQRKRQLQVQVDPKRLQDEGVSLHQIISTTGNALWVSSLSYLNASTPGTGGWIDTPNQRLGIRHILPISKPEDLAKISIEGTPSKSLGDVANVVEDHQPLIGDAIIDDAPALMLVVEKFPWANTMEVTEGVDAALTALQPGLSGLKMDASLFRPAIYLGIAIDNITLALLIGGILAIFILMAFLYNWRAALISTVTILLSIIAAGTVFYLRGITPNMMIIAGLMIALGSIIDDAIIDIENIIKRLRQYRREGSEKSTETVILEAVLEMRNPIVYALLIMILIVVPVLFLEGLSGALFSPIATSYILAVIVSFMIALILIPALSLLLLNKTNIRDGDSPLTGFFQRVYDKFFAWTAHAQRPVFIAICVIVVVGLASLPFLRQESLLPIFKETDLLVNLEGSPGTSHQAINRIATLVTHELRTLEGVRKVSSHVGRAVISDKTTDINSGQIWVNVDPAADYNATLLAVKEVVKGYPGLSHEVLTYLQSKVREELSGTNESLIVRVYGEDINTIRDKADAIKQILAKINGVVDTKVHHPLEQPTFEIEVNLEAAKRYGLKPGDVRRSATTLMSGIEVGNLFEEQKVFDVVVWGTPETRHSLTSIYELLIDTPRGGHVRLQEVAEIRIVPNVTKINRESVARYVDVSAGINGRDLAAVSAEIVAAIQNLEFPLEYRAELLGESAERLASQKRILGFVIATAILIFLLLQAAFRNWRLAAAVFLTLPMALVGGIIAAFMSSSGLISIGSLIGFLAVFSVSLRNSILLINYFQNLEKNEEEGFGPALVLRGTRDRFVPIVMTAIITTLATLPLVFLGNVAGLEILHPMAVILLGGLLTSMLFTVIAIPAIYLIFGEGFEPELDLGQILVDTDVKVQEIV